uniref:Retrovirus-related Pol polyprotein from transposon TNT 1-94 n=1 Tax=Tanacetum cinerariifolium TaxID=118510 RepID=A0A6L2M7V8_TANCI|nr:retrovirus-related Pol polyprotein from transposon TNT 1-94 [Tanacetum cinerariifolium]
MVYFSVIPRDGIFEIDLSNSYTNESSIYAVSNKRAKLYLDSALFWHCRLGYISKKRIEKLQHDEILNSTDLRDFEKCVSCMSGKMARKPYTHQVERAKDLLRLIHTDENKFEGTECTLIKLPNGDALRKCILTGPYIPTTVVVQAVAATDDSPAVLEHTTVETPMNMSPENKAHFESEKEAIHLILTGIEDEIYSAVNAFQTAQEITSKGSTNLSTTTSELPQTQETRMWILLHGIYKPTNNNLRTSSNSRNKNVDTTPRYKNDNQSRQFRNQRTMNVAGLEKIKPKRVKDTAYHKKKMLLCKQAEKGVSLQAEQYDWLADTDKEIDEYELEAHYNYMAKIQEVLTADSSTDSEPLEHNDQNDVESDEERVALANLIANLKLDNKQTEFEKYKAFNDLIVDYDKLERQLNETLGQLAQKDIEIREGLIKKKTKVITDLKLKEEHDIDKMLSLEKQLKFLNEIVYKRNQSIQAIHMMAPKVKSDTVCKEQASNVFQKEREQYFKIQDLKAQLQDKKIAISELKKLNEKCKGKSVETKFDKTSVVRQPNAQRILKPSVLGVNHKTNVSRPHHRSNQMKDKVVPNNSQVKLKKTQVEDHTRIPSISNKIKFVTACNDSLNFRTSNDNAICATCGKCLVDSDHFACVTKLLNDVNARTKKPNIVPISTRKPKGHANKSITTPHKKKIALKSTTQKPKSYYRMMYEKSSKAWKWWIEQQCPSGYKWVPKTKMQWGNDLLIGNRGSDLYTISLQELTSLTPLCLMAKASPTQAWLWHRRLSHFKFDYINLLSKKDVVIGLPKLKYVKDQLCSSCEVSKAKRSSFKSKAIPSSKGRLNFLHIDLCGPMRVASINGKKYILVIADDYSRYTWTLFLHSKDETPELLKEFLTTIQRNL